MKLERSQVFSSLINKNYELTIEDMQKEMKQLKANHQKLINEMEKKVEIAYNDKNNIQLIWGKLSYN